MYLCFVFVLLFFIVEGIYCILLYKYHTYNPVSFMIDSPRYGLGLGLGLGLLNVMRSNLESPVLTAPLPHDEACGTALVYSPFPF